ncbi:glycosyltransferase family 39 protein [Patescibacteria group bacterium]|nr:glycosyltransferase family 39 protein [Patescibacteria group bacterium]
MLERLKTYLTARNLLIAVLVFGSLIRFWGVGTAEIFNDEGFYAFRSIGYLDYIQNVSQTTPIQWFQNTVMPWWTHLSFHDVPPLFFMVQHYFFMLFGDSLLVARLPSLLAGIGTLLLMYYIGKRLFQNEYAGVLAAALLAVSNMHIWISRSSLIEGLEVFIIAGAILIFLHFLEDRKKWWPWLGVALGAAALTKYTAVFIVPVFLIVLLMRDRKLLLAGEFWYAVVLAAILFSPVIVYNIEMYHAVGHFDLQFAYLFHQATPEWQASLGKVQDPFGNIGSNLLAMYSIPFLVLAFGGFVLGLVEWFKKKSGVAQMLQAAESYLGIGDHGNEWAPLAVSAVILITLMLVAVGSAYRFLALYSIFFVILAVAALWELRKIDDIRGWFVLIVIALLAYQLYFAIDGIFMTFPDFGIVKLDAYFSQGFNGMRSADPPQSSNPHLEQVIKDNLSLVPASSTPFMIVYDENVALSARLWLFTRRIYYHGISAVTTGQFKSLLQSNQAALKGITVYFVKASQYTSLNPYLSVPDASDLTAFLTAPSANGGLGLTPAATITGYDGLPMFTVYKFTM